MSQDGRKIAKGSWNRERNRVVQVCASPSASTANNRRKVSVIRISKRRYGSVGASYQDHFSRIPVPRVSRPGPTRLWKRSRKQRGEKREIFAASRNASGKIGYNRKPRRIISFRSAAFAISIDRLSDLSAPPFSGAVAAQTTACKLFGWKSTRSRPMKDSLSLLVRLFSRISVRETLWSL